MTNGGDGQTLWRPVRVWLPRPCKRLAKNGYFYSDGWSGFNAVLWTRICWHGERWYAKRHPITGQPPTAPEKQP